MNFSKFSTNLVTRFKRHLADQTGVTSQVFALAAVPIFMVIGSAIDTDRIAQVQARLHNIADAAALAGGASTGNNAAKIQVAQKYIIDGRTNLAIAGVTYTSTVTAVTTASTGATDVTVSLAASVAGLMLPAAYKMLKANSTSQSGDVAMNLSAVARSYPTAPKPICLLTTDTTAADEIYLNGNNSLTAVGCGVHADSSSATAIHLQGSSDMTADFFEAVGGAVLTGGTGSFSTAPTADPTVYGDTFNLSISNPGSGGDVSPSNGASLADAVYGAIDIKNNVTATFTAGIHYITGTIDLHNGGTLIGSGVTLVLYGPNAKITMNGGTLQLQAPTAGTYAGFAVTSDSTATSVNSLNGGPSTFIRGIWNTPTQDLSITGNSDFNVNSDYFPVVVKTFNMSGNDTMTIKRDYATYGFSEPTALTKPGYNTVYLIH